MNFEIRSVNSNGKVVIPSIMYRLFKEDTLYYHFDPSEKQIIISDSLTFKNRTKLNKNSFAISKEYREKMKIINGGEVIFEYILEKHMLAMRKFVRIGLCSCCFTRKNIYIFKEFSICKDCVNFIKDVFHFIDDENYYGERPTVWVASTREL